jgi:hypothetical protein
MVGELRADFSDESFKAAERLIFPKGIGATPVYLKGVSLDSVSLKLRPRVRIRNGGMDFPTPLKHLLQNRQTIPDHSVDLNRGKQVPRSNRLNNRFIKRNFTPIYRVRHLNPPIPK